MTVRALASGTVRKSPGTITIQGTITRWKGWEASYTPFAALLEDRPEEPQRPQVAAITMPILCDHGRRWSDPCGACKRGRKGLR